MDAVRNALLRWALQLETDGISGEELSFSGQEKATARNQNYSVNNFYGSVGVAQVQQHSPGAVQAGRDVALNIDALHEAIDVLRRIQDSMGESDEARELKAELDTVVAQAESPKPKWRLIKEALQSARRIAESAAGKVVGGALSDELARFDWSTIHL